MSRGGPRFEGIIRVPKPEKDRHHCDRPNSRLYPEDVVWQCRCGRQYRNVQGEGWYKKWWKVASP